MNNKIVETLKYMCNEKDPQDRKIMLLAELVETKCEALSENQESLKESLVTTNEKLDKLTKILENFQHDTETCPVYLNKSSYEKLSFAVKHPKATALALLGLVALMGGCFSAGISAWFKTLLGL